MKKHIAIVLILSGNLVLFSQSLNTKFGKGINIVGADSSYSMKIGLRFQSLFTNDWDVVNDEFGNVSNHTSNFLIRRSRLKFSGFAYDPKFVYKLELGLSNRDLGGGNTSNYSNASRLILDAYVKWNVAKNFWIQAGQSKVPGNRERLISSGNMQMVDRSRLNSRFNLDRDMGIQLKNTSTLGKNFLIREIFSFTQGEGRNLTSGNIGGYAYTFKVEFLPFGKFTSKGDYSAVDLKREKKPKLAAAFVYDINDKAGRERGQGGSFITATNAQLKTLNTFFADFIFKYKGFSFMGEYANRKTKDNSPFVYDDFSALIGTYYTGQSVNLQTGYLCKNGWEPSLRYTHVSPEKGVSNKENEYTVGLSKYIVGHKLKIQTDLSYREVASKDDKLFYRFQIDLHF